eukprot:9437482-Pyramimonas_sp.AAC.1
MSTAAILETTIGEERRDPMSAMAEKFGDSAQSKDALSELRWILPLLRIGGRRGRRGQGGDVIPYQLDGNGDAIDSEERVCEVQLQMLL